MGKLFELMIPESEVNSLGSDIPFFLLVEKGYDGKEHTFGITVSSAPNPCIRPFADELLNSLATAVGVIIVQYGINDGDSSQRRFGIQYDDEKTAVSDGTVIALDFSYRSVDELQQGAKPAFCRVSIERDGDNLKVSLMNRLKGNMDDIVLGEIGSVLKKILTTERVALMLSKEVATALRNGTRLARAITN